ncbi:hypothetical protein [Peredibacter starrii]|uniref:Type II secretion system protein GspF domain-containing protein n=1 Tax=Peredibacter starrii TaxID=28202 RepID=A0AAX4HLV1_9BACT|nr:hypothetical protein [Peredibacter starrii]WPU64243.1 hypothetical protein SOO65_16235 [Peredibacter starrii]
MSYFFYFIIIVVLVYWVERPHMALPNSLIIRKHPAEELEGWLKKFNWVNRQDLSDLGALPSYKFYTEVVEVLLSLARRMGGNYQDSMLFLREGLQVDRQFEKKIREAVMGTWLQMAMMMGLTWMFIFGALNLVDVKVSPLHLFFIFGWQSFGLSSLPFLLKWLRKKYFGDIGKIWKMLFVLRSLVKVPLSRTEVFAIAGVQELKMIKQKALESIVHKLKETCQKALKQGGSYEEEVKYLMEELRFQEKWHFELFEKRLIVIKLALLSIFFLPSYLAFIFLLLGDLMALM